MSKRDEMYEKLRNLDKKIIKKPRKLESENGVFYINPNDKQQKEWFVNEEDFGPSYEGEKDGQDK